MQIVNRQWLLERRPVGTAVPGDFRYHEEPLAPAKLLAGQIAIKNVAFGLAPTMRNWMDPPSNGLYPSIPIGAPVLCPSGGLVTASADPRFPIGSRVTAISSWQDHDVIDTVARSVRPVLDGTTWAEAMGPLGMNALTAYFGVTAVGRPQAGETMLVSGAAGSTGSVAAQIGRISGCRVVGVAGGSGKCAWLREACGIDAVIDYRLGDLDQQIAAACPDGIDVFYDNVGGPVLQTAVEAMNRHGRIVLCGQIAGYDSSRPIPGPTNMMRLIYGAITMQGFLLGDFERDVPAAHRQLATWLREGLLAHREDVRQGFHALPDAFGALFRGTNSGTLLVTADEDADLHDQV